MYEKFSPLPKDRDSEAAWILKFDLPEKSGGQRIFQTNSFQISSVDTALWKLRLESTYINYATNIKLTLTMVDSDEPIEKVYGKISLKTPHQTIPFDIIEPTCFKKNSLVWSRTHEKIFLDNSTLRIEMYVVKSVTSLDKAMSTLLLADDFSDVMLKVGDKSFPAHKAILGARSSVFKAMFKSGMQEQMTSVVQIEDLDSEVIEEMLRYAYSGQVNNLEKLSTGLMIAADKYNMRGLKIKCIDSLLRTLTCENSLERLIFADCFNDALFKGDILEFIALNFNKTKKTPDWDSWATSHPILLNLVLEAVCLFKFP